MAFLIIIAVFTSSFFVWMLIISLKALFERLLEDKKDYNGAPVDAHF
jgi:hypothetical protein